MNAALLIDMVVQEVARIALPEAKRLSAYCADVDIEEEEIAHYAAVELIEEACHASGCCLQVWFRGGQIEMVPNDPLANMRDYAPRPTT